MPTPCRSEFRIYTKTPHTHTPLHAITSPLPLPPCQAEVPWPCCLQACAVPLASNSLALCGTAASTRRFQARTCEVCVRAGNVCPHVLKFARQPRCRKLKAVAVICFPQPLRTRQSAEMMMMMMMMTTMLMVMMMMVAIIIIMKITTSYIGVIDDNNRHVDHGPHTMIRSLQ